MNVNGTTHATDQSRIVRFLARVDRRLRVNETAEALTLGLWALAAVLVVSKLSSLWDRPDVRVDLLLLYLAVLAVFLGWSYGKRKGLFAPAAAADTRADAKDAFKSALDFLEQPERTPWMDFQIRRTADLSEGLPVEEMAPFSLPRRFVPAIGVVVALSAILLWNPRWLQNVDATAWLEAARARTADLATGTPEDDAVSPEKEPEKLEDLDQAIDKLRRTELLRPETLRDLKEAQESLAATQMDMDRLQMDLESVGKALESSSLSDLANAMKNKDPEKAAELLRALADKLSKSQNSEELKALLDALKNSNVQEADLSQLMESLEKAQANMSPEAMEQMAKALQQAADQLQKSGQQMAANQPLDSSGQEMQSPEAGMGQQQGAGQQQTGGEQQAGAQAMQSASGMMSSQLQMAQFQGDPSSAVPVDAGPAGDSTGPGGGDQQVMGEATTLDVQLEMEVLKTEKKEEPVPEEVFERLSRQEKSKLNYDSVSQRRAYDDETALHHESVPWPYRSLVKRYFMSILSNAEAKSESGPEK
jgi:Ca2+-binding EF-hand superfamily protein